MSQKENTAGFIDEHLAFCKATAVHPTSRHGGEPAIKSYDTYEGVRIWDDFEEKSYIPRNNDASWILPSVISLLSFNDEIEP